MRERGSRLSAGEKQLVSLARAALADPSVLVLDEATSNLDPGTEHAVERALERLMDGRTVVVVAHRLSHRGALRPHRGRRRRPACSSSAPTTSSSPAAAATPTLFAAWDRAHSRSA